MATAEQVVDTRSQRRRSKRQRKKQRKREAAAAAAAPAVEATVRSDTRTQQDEGDVVVLQQGDVERRSTLSAAAPEFRPPVAVSVVAGGGGGGRQASGNASSSNGSNNNNSNNNNNNNNSNNGGSGGGGSGGGDSRKRGKRYGGAGGGIPSSHELQQILDIVYHEPKAVQQPGRGRRRGGGGGGSHGSSSRRRRHSSESQYDYEYYAEPYRKEAFVQANYRFVLTPGKHVAASLLEADRPVDWSSVQMVFKPTDTPECCPICLEPPVAARITQCGHVFCFACILHYLTSEVSSGAAADAPKFFSSCRRCPLCQEMVDLDSLKSLEFEVQSSVSAGSRLEVVLLRRPKTLVLAVPVEEAQSTLAQTLWKGGSIGLAEANLPAVRFGRIVVATDLEAKWKRERAQLQAAIDEALVQLETAVAERRAAAKERANTALRLALGASAPSQQQQQQQQQQQAAPQSGNGMSWSGVARRGISSAPVAPSPAGSWSRRVSGGSMSPTTSPPMAPQRSDSDSSMGALDLNSSAQEEAIQLEMVYLRMALDGVEAKLAAAAAATTPTAEEEEVPEDAVSVPSADDLDAWYFLYQAADGSQVFLHSLNYRCLKHEFGDAEHFPPRLEGKILQIERLVMDEINRKRYRFLGHLPLRATFSIVELDLSSFLSPATLNRFASELAERDRARKQVLAAQKKRERRARQKQKQQEAKQQREREARQRERQELHEFLHESPAPLGDQEHFPSISPHASPQSSPVLTRAHTDPSGSVSVWSTVVQHGFASSDLWEPLPGSSSATSPPDAPLPPPMNAQDWVPLSANATPSRSSGSRKGKRRNKGRKVLFSSGYRG